jgi:4-hydroxy-tetrahydrodipicolinate synthase
MCVAGNYIEAAPIYAAVHNLFSWDSRKEFIVAIKVAMEAVGRYGGPTRLPRLPLPANDLAQLKKDIEQAVNFYKNRK